MVSLYPCVRLTNPSEGYMRHNCLTVWCSPSQVRGWEPADGPYDVYAPILTPHRPSFHVGHRRRESLGTALVLSLEERGWGSKWSGGGGCCRGDWRAMGIRWGQRESEVGQAGDARLWNRPVDQRAGGGCPLFPIFSAEPCHASRWLARTPLWTVRR